MTTYLKQGLRASGGEWLRVGWAALHPRTPGLIWVHDLEVGDEMVDRSIHVGRLRPLSLSWVSAPGREPSSLREQAASG
jgi:hypothetical protein